MRHGLVSLCCGQGKIMKKSIGYHTRLNLNNSVKVVGGSFGGDISLDTANRLLSGHAYTVVIKPSGTPVFVDKEGNQVSLYFTIDPASTEIGKKALQEYSKNQAIQRQLEEEKQAEIDHLLSSMSNDEILNLLKANG